MARFLDTIEIGSELQSIIKNAEQELILISPFIHINKRYRALIEEKNDEHIPVTIVWGKKRKQFKFDAKVQIWIKSMTFVKEIFYKDLHAKCYLNESKAIISSMNLYEASEKNVEMGVLITKADDAEAYNDLRKEVKRLIKEKPNVIVIHKKIEMEKKGACIRCKEQIKLDPEHPYCKKDYIKWKKFGDLTYQEKKGVCHICGKTNPSSAMKPACIDCYNKNKDLFKGS